MDSFPANGFGRMDVTGTVRERTSDLPTPAPTASRPCCVRPSPRVAQAVRLPGERHPRRVIEGGSHLCAPTDLETSTTRIGVRCTVRPA